MALYAWGANSYGQLGLGYKNEQILSPTKVSNVDVENIISIKAGAGHTLILTKTGLVFSCGWNNKGQLGYNSNESLDFKQIEDFKSCKIVEISCGWDFSAARSEKGELFVWGSNSFLQLGLPKNIKFTFTPILVENIKIKHISCGLRHLAVLTENNKIMICGSGSKGQLGLLNGSGQFLKESEFKIIPNLSEIIEISCGQYHTLALQNGGTLFGWGNNKHGQLGYDNSKLPQFLTPTKININIIPSKIYTGWTHSVLQTKTGQLFNFGRNNYGQLGNKKHSSNFTIEQISLENVEQFCAGAEHNLAICTGGCLYSWGWNEHGNCGTGDTENILEPKLILKDCQTVFIYCGTGQSFAITKK